MSLPSLFQDPLATETAYIPESFWQRDVKLPEAPHVDASRRFALENLLRNIMEGDDFVAARDLARQMGGKLARIGRQDLADKVGPCFEAGTVSVYESGTKWSPDTACGYSKLCPFHARSETKRRLTVYLDAILKASMDYRLQFLTLTIPNVPVGGYKQAVDGLWLAWLRLKESKCMEPVDGAYANLENTWNINEQAHHPHLHVLLAVKWNEDFSWKAVNERWTSLTGAVITNFEKVSGHKLVEAVREVVKYPAKFKAVTGDTGGGGLLDMTDEAFAEWFEATHGKRTMRSYGIWYNLVKDEEGDEDYDYGDLLAKFAWRVSSGALSVTLIRVDKSGSDLEERLLKSLEKTWIYQNPSRDRGGGG